MSGAGSPGSWSPFDSPFGYRRPSNEAAFGTDGSGAFYPGSLGSEMGGGTFSQMPREASAPFSDEAFPFPGRTASNPGDFGGDFGNGAGDFSFSPEERGTGPSISTWGGLAGDFGAPDAFAGPFGCDAPSLGRDPPPGFGYSRTDPSSGATPSGGFFEGTPNSFGGAFPGCGQEQRGPCTNGFLYEIENYILFIQPTWAGWDFNNQPPLQRVLEHLVSSLLLHYVATYNVSVPGATNAAEQPMEAEIIEIVEEPDNECVRALDVDNEIDGFDEMSEINEFNEKNESLTKSSWSDSSDIDSHESSLTVDNAGPPSLFFEKQDSATMDDEMSISDGDTVGALSKGEEDPPFTVEESTDDATLGQEKPPTVSETVTVSKVHKITENEDAIPAFDLHLSDDCESCASELCEEKIDEYFREMDVAHLARQAQRAVRETGTLAHFASFGLLPKPLSARHRDQRARLMALSLMPFNHDDSRHTRVLEEIYRLYNGNDDACVASQGAHWLEIGFEGEDPGKELRSGGMLTLWMMLHLFNRSEDLAKKMLRESRKKGGGYSFAAMCDIAAGWVIQAMKSGRLNALAEKMDTLSHMKANSNSGDYIFAAQRVFMGLMYKFHHLVMTSDKKLMDVARARKETEAYLKKDLTVLAKIAYIPGALYVDETVLHKPRLMKKLSSALRQRFPKRSLSRSVS